MDTRQIVRAKLQGFMHEFDNENRGNRLSKIMISGMGGFLENLIMEIIQEIEKAKERHENHGKIQD